MRSAAGGDPEGCIVVAEAAEVFGYRIADLTGPEGGRGPAADLESR